MVDMLIRSRKAAFNVMLTVIITVIVGLLLILIAHKLKTASDDVSSREKCHLSLFANDQVRAVAKQAFAIECPRVIRKVKLSEVEKYGRIDDNIVKSIIAKEMLDCWNMVGNGKLNPFNENWLERNLGGDPTIERFCLVCSEIVFDDKFRKQAARQGYELKDLHKWFVSHKPYGMDHTLYESITGGQPSEELLKALASTDYTPRSLFSLDKPLIIVWKVEVPTAAYNFWLNMGRQSLGVEKVPINNGIYIMPYAPRGKEGTGPAIGIGDALDENAIPKSEFPKGTPAYTKDISNKLQEQFKEDPAEYVVLTTPDTMTEYYGIMAIGRKVDIPMEFCSIMVN